MARMLSGIIHPGCPGKGNSTGFGVRLYNEVVVVDVVVLVVLVEVVVLVVVLEVVVLVVVDEVVVIVVVVLVVVVGGS